MALIPIEQMPKKYQTQFPRAVKELTTQLRTYLTGIESPTLHDIDAVLAEMSFEIRDKRIGVYGPDCHQITYERHLDWQTQIEDAAMAQIGPEFGIVDERYRP